MGLVYLKLAGAEQLRFPDGSHVHDVATYLMWQAAQLSARGVAARHESTEALEARVEHGRWIVNCSDCRAGLFTAPEIPVACCAECGAVYRRIVFPDDAAAIANVLLARPLRENQGWLPSETLDDLKRENREHGLDDGGSTC